MDPTFKSKLEHGRQRFLVYAIEHAFEVGRRTPEDFIRHFPPKTIMQALSMRPDLRASLLVPTTGLRPRIALKKTWQSAGEDIQSALDEGETKPIQIVEAFAPDDRVLYLEDKKVWAFLVEGEFWKVTAKEDKARFAVAQQHVAYLLDRALLEGLITARDVVDALGVNELCNRLPRTEIATLFSAALDRGRAGAPFTDQDLLTALPPATIVQHVPLPHIVDTILHKRVATVHGYLEEPKPAEPPPPEPPPAEPSKSELAPPAAAPETATPATEEPKIAAKSVPPEGTPKSNGRRRTNPPAANGEAAAAPDDETEWIEMPESTR